LQVKGISGNYNKADLRVSLFPKQMLFQTEHCETDMHIHYLKIYQQNVPQLHHEVVEHFANATYKLVHWYTKQ